MVNVASDIFSFGFLPWEKEGQSQIGLVDRTLFFSALLVPIATSATAVVTATGTSSWLAPWRHFLGFSLSFSVCLSLFLPLFFFVFLFALLLPSIVLRNVEPASNLLFPLSEFVFILTAPLPLCNTYHSISLSSLIQHPPSTFSASMLPPHSALFLSLSLSTLITPFSLPFLCSLHFKLLFLLLYSTSI